MSAHSASTCELKVANGSVVCLSSGHIRTANSWHDNATRQFREAILQGCYGSVWVSDDWVIHNAVWCVCLNVLDPSACPYRRVQTEIIQRRVSIGCSLTGATLGCLHTPCASPHHCS